MYAVCWVPGRIEGTYNDVGRIYMVDPKNNQTEIRMEWTKPIETPKECQLKCQETLGCCYFGHEKLGKRCVFYNQKVIKPLVDMDISSSYYGPNIAYSSENVAITGPRHCLDKKRKYVDRP